MAEAVEWQADGTPFSPRFGDIYRSEAGGLEQARHVFLQGCEMPAAWCGLPQWCILETGFGLGLNFLATWQAWLADPQRPRMLHVASIEAWPATAQDLLRSAAPYPELMPLAEQLARQWHGLLPGFHRLVFEGGQLLLTLCVGDVKPMLRELRFDVDAVFLDGFAPQHNPAMWDIHTLKSVARLCRRGTRLATWTSAGEVKQALRECGFVVKRAEGLPPKRHRLVGVFDPAWALKKREPVVPAARAGRCIVVGGGLAGAAVAGSLARRGWSVEVLDAADQPACGASGLPAGLLAPQVSPDDNLLSRLSRCGIRMSLQQADALLTPGVDWQANGVLEHRIDGTAGLPALWPDAGRDWTRAATPEELAEAGLPAEAVALWHTRAGWIKPAYLVRAWLAQPGVSWRGGVQVSGLKQEGALVKAVDAAGRQLAEADLVVIAAGPASAAVAAHAGELPLQAIRGQVSWAVLARPEQAMPAFPVNGHGSLIPAVPSLQGQLWLAGASFERGSTDTRSRASDHLDNLQRLRALLPKTAAQLTPAFDAGGVQAWAGVRCASPDRLPLVGQASPVATPGVWVCTAMGSRGLSFAALCGELLAARLHHEPLPLERRHAAAIDTTRYLRKDA
ncbi:MAG: FAD-dependent 5-carboxymethylaminomethyl-2-thiouridine(34) oxidoreductase MnmC [Bdellovibrionales bacterium]|nr:FAD-dependent 5-carboxymethylaminomethyl-2-thiouridine(34) oxidoreductase MnmC [Ramlibacter sp.]